MKVTAFASVGKQGKNMVQDVKIVQALLNIYSRYINKFFNVFFITFLVSAGAMASDEKSVPLSIDEVISGRVDNALMRVIVFNTEIEPKMDVELIKTPERRFLSRKEISGIQLGDEYLDFRKGAYVLIENVHIHDNQVDFDVMFQFEGRPGDYSASCSIMVEKMLLKDAVCKRAAE